MKKFLMAVGLVLMPNLYGIDRSIYRSGYSTGHNIEYTLTEDAFLIEYPELNGDIRMRIDQMNKISESGSDIRIYLKAGKYKFNKKGYYILKFVPVNSSSGIEYLLAMEGYN